MGQEVHPGVRLDEELKKRGWTQLDLTFVLGCGLKSVNQIINGKQGISPSMSKALGVAFDLPFDYFAGLQREFDLSSASDPDAGIQLRAKMQRTYPIREMVRRGWVKADDPQRLTDTLAKFFEVSQSGEIPYLSHAAKKSRYEDKEIPPAQIAWLFRVRQIAKTISVPKYSEKALQASLGLLRDMLIAPEEARHVPRVLAESGVRFVIVESLPQAQIDGVCFWLDKHSPVIGLSFRFDRIDNFWFVLRHEIEHVLRGHGRTTPEGIIDANLEGERAGTGPSVSEEERIANAAAADFCVTHDKMQSFILRKNPFFYEKDILAFAKINGVHPGLPVGQIQFRTGRYDYLKRHQVKIRQFVLPGSVVDGWDQSLEL